MSIDESTSLSSATQSDEEARDLVQDRLVSQDRLVIQPTIDAAHSLQQWKLHQSALTHFHFINSVALEQQCSPLQQSTCMMYLKAAWKPNWDPSSSCDTKCTS
eukprot:227606-Pelagomonas_calceolata.AAC.1